MIVRRALKNSTVVAGGGAIDVCINICLPLSQSKAEDNKYIDDYIMLLGCRWK